MKPGCERFLQVGLRLRSPTFSMRANPMGVHPLGFSFVQPDLPVDLELFSGADLFLMSAHPVPTGYNTPHAAIR